MDLSKQQIIELITLGIVVLFLIIAAKRRGGGANSDNDTGDWGPDDFDL